MKKELVRPNKEAMLRLLNKYVNRVEEVIFRLAWQAGLTRQEILDLKWTDISFDDGMINLPHRSVPIVEDLSICLGVRRIMAAPEDMIDSAQPYVVVTDGHRTHPTKVHLSRLVAAAIDGEESLRGLRLDDLRNDFIIRILEKNTTEYAMKVAGINRVSINATFGNYLPVKEPRERGKRSNQEPIDEQRLRAFIQAEGSSEVAIALQFSWELGLSVPEIISLTWKQINFEKKELRIKKTVYPLSDVLTQMLQKAFSNSLSSEDTHILLTPRAKQPFDKHRLSKVVRNALVRGGLEDLSFRRLSQASRKGVSPEEIYSYINEHGFITKKQVSAVCGVHERSAQNALHDMVEQRLLVRKGKSNKVKYYLAEEK